MCVIIEELWEQKKNQIPRSCRVKRQRRRLVWALGSLLSVQLLLLLRSLSAKNNKHLTLEGRRSDTSRTLAPFTAFPEVAECSLGLVKLENEQALYRSPLNGSGFSPMRIEHAVKGEWLNAWTVSPG